MIVGQCPAADGGYESEEEEEGEGTKGFRRGGKGFAIVLPQGSSEYSCCSQRGLFRGAFRSFIAALVVEIRPSARSVKVVVGGSRYKGKV